MYILISAIIAQIRNDCMQITSERSVSMTRVNDGGETTECRKVLGVSWDHRQTARKITWAVCRCNTAPRDVATIAPKLTPKHCSNRRLKFTHSLYANLQICIPFC